MGIDVIGFKSVKEWEGAWDNFQCKRYKSPLTPGNAWVEIAKIIYYSHEGHYKAPETYYFIGSQGIGLKLEKLLAQPAKLKEQCRSNWAASCENEITSTKSVPLSGKLLEYFDAFDFSIFKSKSPLELIAMHSKSPHHAVRFGGGLPPRPSADPVPSLPTPDESCYVRKLLDAYGEHVGQDIKIPSDLAQHPDLQSDFVRQRERFYAAEALRNFARDTVPDGTFARLQDEIHDGVIDVVESDHASSLHRMRATVTHASVVSIVSNALATASTVKDRQGICHQLANDERLHWKKI
jgi:hypothetical protein